MNSVKRSSSSGSISIFQKIQQAILLTVNQVVRVRKKTLAESISRDIDEYDELCRAYVGRSIHELSVFEIGYGARPYRLISMISLGINARGVDLDAPLLDFNIGDLQRIYRNNGVERLVKSMVRFLIGDVFETRQIRAMIESRGKELQIPKERFHVGDASEVVGNIGQFDVFLSEDVFEHIPRENLELLVERMAKAMSAQGIAIIRPNIFTGISGGHRVEWFQDNIGKRWCAGWSEPWGHLRKSGTVGDTYLNELTRAEYRELFSKHFEVICERVKIPDLGIEYLTDEVTRELSGYARDELFSNQVLFVLKKK